MKTAGIICEYNPLHLGHKKQLDYLRSQLGPDCAIVCLMSGNYVQRGAPAIVDKQLRAKAALLSGADLVLELPVTYALSSAEGFARGGVEILGNVCDYLCFGAETPDSDALMNTAKALLSDSFPPLLRAELDTGKSFPAARSAALAQMGLDSSLLESPNNILAVEYCKAILSQKTDMRPMVIHRQGDYHDLKADQENPSATAIRRQMLSGEAWSELVPKQAAAVFESAMRHSTIVGERAVLARLRTMRDEEFEALPYGSEGLWRKLMHESRRQARLEDIAEAVKSKRYTRTRIDRLIMCAFLGITSADLQAPAPYARVLAFNDRGREILKRARQSGWYPNIGERTEVPYEELELRCDDLYGLFAEDKPEAAGLGEKRRIIYSHASHSI